MAGGEREERANLLQATRGRSRALASEMQSARSATLRAVRGAMRDAQSSERAERAAASAMLRAWGRAPRHAVATRMQAHGLMAGRPRRPDSASADSIHFRLESSNSGIAAAKHQAYIERSAATMASFGNISDDAGERERLWTEIAQRSQSRRGTIKITEDAPTALKRACIEAANAHRGRYGMPQGALAGATRCARRGGEDLDDLELTLHTADRAEHETLLKAIEPHLGNEGTPAMPNMKGDGVAIYAPRAPIVQRRLVLELAHELAGRPSAMINALRGWCEKTLGNTGVGWHATVHRPERGNDSRNYHAHIVFTQCDIKRCQIGPRPGFEFERSAKAPPPAPAIRVLAGNGPDKRKGSKAMVTAWRSAWCDEMNGALARAGEEKRYDPRSYAARGIEKTAGKHRGTVQSGIEKRDIDSVKKPQDSDEPGVLHEVARALADELWREAQQAIEKRENDDELRNEALDALERLRLRAGLGGEPSEAAARAQAAIATIRTSAGADTLASTIDAIADGSPEPAAKHWRERWEAVENEGLDADTLGTRAEQLAREAGGAATISAFALAPRASASIRRLATLVVAHRARREEWQGWAALVDDTTTEGAQADRRANEMEERAQNEGANMGALLGERLSTRVHTAAARHRRFTLAQQEWEGARTAMERGTSPEKVAAFGAKMQAEHREHFMVDSPGRAAELTEWVTSCRNAARIRSEFHRACNAPEGSFASFESLYHSEDRRIAGARELLTPQERTLMSQVGDGPEAVRARMRELTKRVDTLLENVYPNGTDAAPNIGALDETLANQVLRNELAEGAPGWLAHLETIGRETETRREHLGELIEESRHDDLGKAGRACANAMHGYGDLLALRNDAGALAIEERAQRWVEHVANALTGRDDERTDERDRRVSGLAKGDNLEWLEARAPSSALAIREAAIAELGHRARARESVKKAEQDMRKPSGAVRKRGRTQIETLLADAVQRARLAPGETQRLTRVLNATGTKERQDRG